MKKLLAALCAFAFIFSACEPEVKPENPDNPDGPSGNGEFVLTSDANVTVDAAGGDVKVEFTSTVDWAASLDVESSVATLSVKSGSAEDTFVKVTVKAYEEKNSSRTIKLTLKPEGLDNVVVTITQNGQFEPYFKVSADHLTAPVGGGEVTFTIETNTEFTVKTYDDFEEWAPFTLDGTTGKFTVAANPELEGREAYVKFLVPAIQVAVLDEDGKDTGETEDMPVRVYLTQAGHATIEYVVPIPDEIVNGATNYSLAFWSGYLLLCNGPKLYLMNAQTGELVQDMGLDLGDNVLKCVTTDDAGDLLLAINGGYTEGLTIMAVPSQEGRDQANIIYYPNPYYGYGFNNIKAKGDVYGQAVVTAFAGGAASAGGQTVCAYWNIGDGMAAWEQATPGDDNSWRTPPTIITPDHLKTRDVWDSFRMFFNPVGPRVSDGFVFNGYDGQYKYLYYNGSAWNDVLSTPYTWESGVNSFVSFDWGGEAYSIGVGMSYFPCWAIPSDIWLMKGNGSSLENVAKLSYSALSLEGLNADSGVYQFKPDATDVIALVDGDNVYSFIVDGALKVLVLVSFSK